MIEVDFSELNETAVDVWQHALDKLPDEKKASIEAEFQGVNVLACEAGIAALIGESNFHSD